MSETRVPRTVPRFNHLKSAYSGDELAAQTPRFARLAALLDDKFPAERSPATLPTRFYSSPGRTELGGNHTDHNRGRVLAAAIDLDSIAAVRPRRDKTARVFSEGFGGFELELSDTAPRPEEKGTSVSLARGIAAAFPRELRGFDAVIHSDVVPGSGLSSSASFEVLIAAIIADLASIEASPADLAAAGQYAENEYFGKPCGLMDQMACALGNIVALDFGEPGQAAAELIPYDFSRHDVDLFIINTGGSHADLTDEYAAIPEEMASVAALFGKPALRGISLRDLVENVHKIRSSCGDRAFLRAWHFVGENERALAMKSALASDDFPLYLSLVRASGDSSWKYLQNIYSPKHPKRQGLGCALAVAELYTKDGGACRVHGGGFAGTIQAYVPKDASTEFRLAMRRIFGDNSIIPLRIRPFGVVCISSIS